MILLRYYRLLDLINESNVLDVSEPLVEIGKAHV